MGETYVNHIPQHDFAYAFRHIFFWNFTETLDRLIERSNIQSSMS
jgi:hypothetical protein